LATASRANYPFGIGEIVSARARKGIREFLASLDDDEGFLGKFPRAIAELAKVSEEGVAAMTEHLDSEKPRHRLMASYMLLSMSQQRPASVTRAAFERAEAVMLDALNSKDEDTCPLAAALISNGGVTPKVAAVLEEFLRDESQPFLRVFAAVGLLRKRDGQTPNKKAETVLQAALYGKTEILAGLAGATMLQLNIAGSPDRRKVIEQLPLIGENGQFQILVTLKHFGGETEDFYDVLVELLENRSVHKAVRQEAALLLGRMSRSSDKAMPLLLESLRSKLWEVVTGAVQGLEESQRIPDDKNATKAVAHLITLLSHAEPEMRSAAAHGIPLMGDARNEGIPALVARLREERNGDVCVEIVMALSGIGEPAIPALIGAIQEGEAWNVEHLVRALGNIGEKAAITIAELLPKTVGRVSEMLVGVLMSLGSEAKSAVGLLARMLDETEEQAAAITVAMAIFFCGRSAGEAIPALIRCIAGREANDQVVLWAERSLWCMREESLPALKLAVAGTDGDERDRLERVVAGMETPITNGFSRLDDLQCDELIELFVAIGGALEGDARMNWPKITTVIAGKSKRKEFQYPQKGLGERNLQNKMKSLEGLLAKYYGKKVILTTQGRNRPCTLTAEGKAFLGEGREYLQLKASLRKQERKKG
jgi:hypothetical protein